jgi:VanZ family protein
MSTRITDELKHYIEIPEKLSLNSGTVKLDYNFILRKATHFTEYFVLSLLLYRALLLCRIKHIKCIIAAFIFCVAYAVSDEFHQIFVKARSSKAMDIGIDSLGALCALFLICLWKRIKKWRRKLIYKQ